MLNQKGASRMDTVVKLALVFIISLLSFSIGTFVGKQFSDQQHKTAMIESDDSQSRTTASIPADSLDVKPENALTDADIASITEEFAKAEQDDIDELLAANETATESGVEIVEDEAAEDTVTKTKEQSIDEMMAELGDTKTTVTEIAKKETTVKKDVKIAEATTTPVKDIVSETAKKITKNEKPVVKDKKVVNRIPTSLPSKIAASSVGRYTVQVAAYQKVAEADAHKTALINQGYSAFHVEATVKGNKWYRVNVGLFADRTKASVFRKRLMSEASLKTALVKKIVR